MNYDYDGNSQARVILACVYQTLGSSGRKRERAHARGKGALARKAPENLACVEGKYFHHKLMFSLNFKNRDMIWPILDYSYSLDKAFLLDKAFHSPKFLAKIIFHAKLSGRFLLRQPLKTLEATSE